MTPRKDHPARALFEVPIFYRIVIANTAMAGMAVIALIVFRTDAAAAAVVIVASGIVNALLVKAALGVHGMRRQQRELFAWSLHQAENERARIVNEIQESAAQRLATVLLDKNAPAAVSAEAAGVIEQLVATAETLRPPRLEFLGLPAALAWYCRSLERRTAARVALTSDGPLEAIDHNVALGIYRVVEDVAETLAASRPLSFDFHIAADDGMVTISVSARLPDPQIPGFTGTEVFRLNERIACMDGLLDIARSGFDIRVRITTPTREAHARHDPRIAG